MEPDGGSDKSGKVGVDGDADVAGQVVCPGHVQDCHAVDHSLVLVVDHVRVVHQHVLLQPNQAGRQPSDGT